MENKTEYRVLARKYRPQDFSNLIGQEPTIRTLTNAFSTNRIAQAWMLTGVRGVGKTTTARILARALNYEYEDIRQPNIDMSQFGEHCQAIMDGRHVDVVEMDAASHTGIDDIRDIIEQVRYRPVSARYKVYIIDEIHMLSTQAFNGLLKTLEEPPEHVKFIFATTEIRKVPITVLSRCQRFDLRRIEVDALIDHFKTIMDKEKVTIDHDSLSMIARASEGSVRDGLSLLDQAIAHGGGDVKADTVRTMLGLADRTRITTLFDLLMKGQIREALEEFREQYNAGANPLAVLTDLADFTHLVTRLKYVPEARDDTSLNETERTRGAEFSEHLSTPILSRTWQMLLKAIHEVSGSGRAFAATEMALIRIAHSAHLPTPEDLAKTIQNSEPEAKNKTTGRQNLRETSDTKNYNQSGGHLYSQAQTSNRVNNSSALMAVEASNGPESAVLAVNSSLSVPDSKTKTIQDIQQEPDIKAPDIKVVEINTIEDLAALADKNRDMPAKIQIRHHVRLVKARPGHLEINLTKDGSPKFPGDLINRLKKWTGVKWTVALSREQGGATLAELEAEQQKTLVIDAKEDKDVIAILAKFPGARITDVRISLKDDDEFASINAENG